MDEPEQPGEQQPESAEEELGPEALDQVTDEEALEAAPQLHMPTMTIPLTGMNARLVKENGTQALVVGPVMVNFVLPFTEEQGKGLARELTSGIDVAHGAADIGKAVADASAAFHGGAGLKAVT